MDESQPKTLYVGNLDQTVSEDLLVTLFSKMGGVKSCKIIREPGNDPYAFIEYMTYQAATTALTAMNKRVFLDKEIKVNWATSPGNQPKTDISSHHHIFVGDLGPEIETETLRDAFAPFGEISMCRIVRDPQTMKSRGYAFVSFVKKAEAENAIQAMNGSWLGHRPIRTNWSTRKIPAPRETNKSNIGGGGIGSGPGAGLKNNTRHTYEEIYNQTSPTNTTVYCGGFPANVISDELMRKHFMQYGPIQDVRVFKDKGYAFIKFMTKESAARAIEHTHNSEVHGNQVKCFWGKENGGDNSMNNIAAAAAAQVAAAGAILGHGGMPTNSGGGMPQQSVNAAAAAQVAAATGAIPGQMMTTQQLAAAAQYPYAYQQMGYWYPQGYPTAAAAQMQAQYMQQSYYPYAYTSAQQAGAAGYRMVQPNVAYMPGTAVVPGVTAATSANGTLAPQMMYSTTAMPQYQTQ